MLRGTVTALLAMVTFNHTENIVPQVLPPVLISYGNQNETSSMLLSDCSLPNSIAKVTSFSFVPENPIPGDNTVLTVKYDLLQDISGGTTLYSVTMNGIPFPNTKDDLCTQTVCPKYIGSQTEISKSVFPEVSGKITSQIQWFNTNDDPIWCIKMIYKS